MGAHPEAFQGLLLRLQRAKDADLINELLDQWNDWTLRATEWDATQWGFDESWMTEERREMIKRMRSSDDSPRTMQS